MFDFIAFNKNSVTRVGFRRELLALEEEVDPW